MSVNARALDSGAAGAMTLEGWCVLAMGALFGLFLFGVWWELRCNLRSISHQARQRERTIARMESEAAFVRELAREAASQRVVALRVAERPHLQVLVGVGAPAREERLDEAPPHALGMESVGRILERLAQSVPQMEDEAPVFGAAARARYERPTLNMVRGGKSGAAGAAVGAEEKADASEDSEAAAPQARPKKSSQGRARARDGVKSSSIGSSAIGSGALFASR